MIAIPCAAARSASAGGTGAPPSPTRCMCRACAGVKSGWSMMLARNTDAPVPAPMPASSMMSSARAGSHRSMRWMSWPTCIGPRTAPSMPVAWVTGEPIRFGDSGVIHDPHVQQLRRATCGACASRPSGRSSSPTCTPARTRRRDRSPRPARRARRVRRCPIRLGSVTAPRAASADPTTRCRRRSLERARGRAVDDVEVVDVAVPIGGDVRARRGSRRGRSALPSGRRCGRSARARSRPSRARRTRRRPRASSAAGRRLRHRVRGRSQSGR